MPACGKTKNPSCYEESWVAGTGQAIDSPPLYTSVTKKTKCGCLSYTLQLLAETTKHGTLLELAKLLIIMLLSGEKTRVSTTFHYQPAYAGVPTTWCHLPLLSLDGNGDGGCYHTQQADCST